MPIVNSDIIYALSGGASNSDVNASLGGVISSTLITDDSLHNLFDAVSEDESAAGDTEYRCLYIVNNHGSLTWGVPKVWIETNTLSVDSDIAIALGTSAVNGVEQTVADESSAPAGVTWQNLTGVANAFTIADIPAGEHKAIWLRRTILLGAAAYDGDEVFLNSRGKTDA